MLQTNNLLLRSRGVNSQNKDNRKHEEKFERNESLTATNALRRLHELECEYTIYNNSFEQAAVMCHNYKRTYENYHTEKFENNLCLAKEILKDTLSESLRRFFIKNPWIPTYEASYRLQTLQSKDDRPLWKRLRAQKKCDVVSVLEEDVTQQLPVQKAKRALTFKIATQKYLQRSWKDMVFLQKLKTDNNIKESLPQIEDLIAEQYGKTKVFLQMLHKRTPMYTLPGADPLNHIAVKMRAEHKYHLQYQSHRDALALLRVMRALRQAKARKKMHAFIEEDVSKYLSIKTQSVMPGLFELVTEIYNIYALTVADCYVVPANIMHMPAAEKMLTLLQIPFEVYNIPAEFVFGDKSTVIDLTEDRGLSLYK